VQPAGGAGRPVVGAVPGALVASGAAEGGCLAARQGAPGGLDGTADPPVGVPFPLSLVDADQLQPPGGT
jgi:hypothetical protein